MNNKPLEIFFIKPLNINKNIFFSFNTIRTSISRSTTRPAIQTFQLVISCRIQRFLVTAGAICWEDRQFVQLPTARFQVIYFFPFTDNLSKEKQIKFFGLSLRLEQHLNCSVARVISIVSKKRKSKATFTESKNFLLLLTSFCGIRLFKCFSLLLTS